MSRYLLISFAKTDSVLLNIIKNGKMQTQNIMQTCNTVYSTYLY